MPPAFCDGSHHARGHSHASRGIPSSKQAHQDVGDGEHGISGIGTPW